MKKTKIELYTDEEIIARAKKLGDGRSWLIRATKSSYQDCDILACVLGDSIINWSVYCGDDWCGVYYSDKEGAIAYLKDCEK